MKYTDKLGLPIWNKPETDVFDIEQFNEGMQAIDDIVIRILKQINDLVIGDTQIDLNGYVKEEVLKEYDKIIANKADKREVVEISSQLDTKTSKEETKNVQAKLANDIEIIDTKLSNSVEIINSNNQKIDNKINTINNNLSNYMLKSDLVTETGSIALGDNIKIATESDGKQLFTLEKNKEGIIVGNITVSTVNGLNDITHNKLLFTLNENYRPSHQIIIPCYCSRASQPDKIIGAISIYEDGRVLINLFEKSSDGDIYPVETVFINFFIKVD